MSEHEEGKTIEGLSSNLLGYLGFYRKHDSLPLVSQDKRPQRAQMLPRQEGREKKLSKSYPWHGIICAGALLPSQVHLVF